MMREMQQKLQIPRIKKADDFIPAGADPEGGGAGGARPPVFAQNYLKSTLKWPK